MPKSNRTRKFCVPAYFDLCGFVSKQNCGIWCTINPRIIHERELHRRCWHDKTLFDISVENIQTRRHLV